MANEGSNRYGFYPADPGAVPRRYKIAASQTIAAGDPVILSSGQIAIAVSNSSTELCGIAAEPASGKSANDPIMIYDDPDMVFIGRSSTAPSNGQCGTAYDLTGTTGAFQVNFSATSQAVMLFLGEADTDETNTTAGAKIRVKIALNALAEVST